MKELKELYTKLVEYQNDSIARIMIIQKMGEVIKGMEATNESKA